MHWAERIPWERIILGIAVIWGFVGLCSYLLQHAVPEGNREIVLSMVAVLGTAVGAVVGAIFRQNAGDEAKNRTIETLANTAAAPLTTTTITEVTTDGQANRDQASERDLRVAGDAPVIEPISDDDTPADLAALPNSPPGQRT